MGGLLTLPKISEERGDQKIAEGWYGVLRRTDSVGNRRCFQSGYFSSQCVANVTLVTFNYILVIVFLFSLNVGVSPCFHCTVLAPVYRKYTSCFHNTVVSSCYRLHTFYLHHAGVTSCFSLNMWFRFILEICHQSGVDERVHTCSLTYGQSVVCFDMMGLGANFTMREVASSANSCAKCHYHIYQDIFIST